MIVWWNDRLMESGEVRIPLTDATYLRGEGVFETIRVIGGVPLFMLDHSRRLKSSAEKMFLKAPGHDVLEKKIRKLVAANDLEEARVRVTLGENCLITAEALEEDVSKASVSTVGEMYPVNERSRLAGVKCTSYAENMNLLFLAGAGEVLRPNMAGELCEGCVSNVFFVKDGKVHTPALETGCLPGVMRKQVMERVGVVEGRWPFEILTEVDEIWLSNTIRKIRFVSEMDGRPMGELSELFLRVRSQLP